MRSRKLAIDGEKTLQEPVSRQSARRVVGQVTSSVLAKVPIVLRMNGQTADVTAFGVRNRHLITF